MSPRRVVAASAALGVLAIPAAAQAKPVFLDSYSPPTPPVQQQETEMQR